MKSPRFLSLLLLVPLAAALSLTGCDKDEDEDSTTTKVESIQRKPAKDPRVKLSFTPSAKQRKRIADIAKHARRERPRFNRSYFKASNAPLFAFIVATRDRGFLREAGLKAMMATYGTAEGQAAIDADYVAVVGDALTAENTEVLQQAIAAAGHGLSDPKVGGPLLAPLLAKTEDKSAAVQFAAVLALEEVPAEARNEAVVKALTTALDSPNVYIVSAALKSLQKSAKNAGDPAALMKRTLTLTTHEDPGVRGNALQLAAAIAAPTDAPAETAPADKEGAAKGDKEAPKKASTTASAKALQTDALKAALLGLHDTNGFVRAASCNALVTLGNKAAIHPMLTLTTDMEASHYTLKGFKDMSDRDDQLVHSITAVDSVADVAQDSVRKLSGDKVKLAAVPNENPKEVLEQNASAVKAWYTESKASLPKASALPAVKLPAAAKPADVKAGETPKAEPAKAEPVKAEPAKAAVNPAQ